MGESTQGYGGTALPQGGAVPALRSGEITQWQYDHFSLVLAAFTTRSELPVLPIDQLRRTAEFRSDIRRELRNRERLLAGVNYRMQFFREAV